MNRYRFKKLNNGWLLQIDGLNGKAFRLFLRYFNKRGFKLIIDLNAEILIRLFRLNEKIIEVR